MGVCVGAHHAVFISFTQNPGHMEKCEKVIPKHDHVGGLAELLDAQHAVSQSSDGFFV